ncbi:WD domain, G-beta repeat protein (macronuclear) [Tetrahymena thermophila SB210]|uniref:WD domain, G-beta repeat protein n=1 Tax=Tetrahymena thermophila (strain SB210) TaxID=312017 RepID=Q22D06_TETTS|nr:WD domain, G-beta repeat protein [Tetrahymena thermophila SB210]EAR83183.2 WD domain, G-beta repeat protein [Tetrahymena thermophila SB210]|eukprot:XP_001030846.2 WD domain, G-beta repeat protein [Tetrahymena thermophila SB210]
MRVKSVGQSVKYSNKNSQKVSKKQEKIIRLQSLEELKLIPQIYVKEVVLTEVILSHLDTLSRVVNLLQKYENTRQEINLIAFDQNQVQEVFKHLDSHLDEEQFYPQVRNTRNQMRKVILKQLSHHLTEIQELYDLPFVHQCLYNQRQLQREVLLNRFDSQIQQIYLREANSRQTASIIIAFLAHKKKENAMRVYKEINTIRQLESWQKEYLNRSYYQILQKYQQKVMQIQHQSYFLKFLGHENQENVMRVYDNQNAMKYIGLFHNQEKCQQQFKALRKYCRNEQNKQSKNQEEKQKQQEQQRNISKECERKYSNISSNLASQKLTFDLSQTQRANLSNLIQSRQITQFKQKLIYYSTKQSCSLKQKSLKQIQDQCQFKENKLLGGGGCGSKPKLTSKNADSKKKEQQQQKQIEKIIDEKEQLKKDFEIQKSEDTNYEELKIFKEFNKKYDEYFDTEEVSAKEIETHVRRIIENALYDFREQIVQTDIRLKVIDLINLLINYLLIIKQSDSKSSIQSDINQIGEKIQRLIIYCKENKERHACLDLYQYFEILKALNSQRIGLDEANKHIAIKIFERVVEVVKFGAGFVSISGAIKNLTEIDLDKLKKFFNQVKQIAAQAIKDGKEIAYNYNSNNLTNNMMSLWLQKVEFMGDNLSDNILEIIFYLEESEKITNNDTRLFVYMQLNYLLSKQQKKDNFKELSNRLQKENKLELIINQSKFLQVEEYSDGIINKLKNLANFMVKNHQFRYLKAQLLLHFAQILSQLQKKNEFDALMIGIVSNYLQEKQKSVKITYQNNQILADFIHNHLDKSQILIQINQFKNQITKHLDDKQEYNEFAYDIQNENDLDKQLAKYYVEIWKQSVEQRQKMLQMAHKDDVLLEAIHLYVNQQITYIEGQEINTEEKDAVKQIIDQFLIPNFVVSQDDIQEEEEGDEENNQKNNEQSCKIISILAEGGSGKSMLLKKLEVELLNRDSDYTKDNRSDFIPLIIKCNSLDSKNPSIEDYLESVNIQRKDIDLLKKSERNKLIMLDGYDEYNGDYFKVYHKLKLNEWVNTLIIVTSRLEKITVSDAKIYFNYYDSQGMKGQNNSFAIFKLEKITHQDIEDYLSKYKQQSKNTKDFNPEQHDKLKDIIFKNKQLTQLLKLPINLYLATRMINDLDLNNENISNAFQEVSDQIEIQELFFSQQFKKQSKIFIEQQKKLSITDMQKQELMEKVESCYFEYFQFIAMHMFIQKGQKSNYLSTTRDSIQFKIREEVSAFFKKSKINVDDLIEKLNNYVDSRVVTRIQLKFNEQTKSKQTQSQTEKQKVEREDLKQEFEFRHKSLFEYFAARAMKYDFDLHQDNVFKLDIQQLKQFNINKRIIMSNQKNASEQQILLKLYKLMKSYLCSPFFKQTYTQDDISKTNKYIQFIKKSTISKQTQISDIDIGASNLLSALFVSKFSYPHLIFKKCSFSQTYISSKPARSVEFIDCNLNDSLIERQNLENYETSNTRNAVFSGFQKYCDTEDVFSFNQVIFYKNTLVTITKTGYINQFDIKHNNNKSYKQLISKHITNSPLKTIHLINPKNIFVVSAKKSLFEINTETFEILNTFTFSFPISNLTINNSKYLATLVSNQVFYGDIQSGFKLLDVNRIQAEQSLLTNNNIITFQNQEIDIYSLSSLQIIKNIQNFPSSLTLSSLTHDGKYLATCSDDKKCQIWNLENGFELINTIETGHTKALSSVSFSSDGKFLATGSLDTTCKIWVVENGFQLQNTIKEHKGSISSVAFSVDNKYLATGSEDKTCSIWNVEKGFDLLNKIEGETSWITSVAFSADGKYVATGSQDKTCKVWKVDKGFELFTKIEGHTEKITSVAFSSDRKYLATSSRDNTCKIWNAQKDFELISTIKEHQKAINQVAFSSDSKYLATASSDFTCKIWDIQKGFLLINSIEGHDRAIQSVAFSPNGKYLATGSFDSTCKIWDVEKEFQIVITIEERKTVYSVAFSSDGKYIATGSDDNTCKIWNIEKGFEFTNKIEGHRDQITSVTFSTDGKYLATSSNDKICKIWNVEKGFELFNTILGHTSLINSVAFSADSKYLVSGSDDKTCKIWNIEKGFEVIYSNEGHTECIYSIDFSADGKYVATGSWDSTCKIWNIEKGYELINTIEGHTSNIRQVAFSTNGKYLATGSDDNTCKIWNVHKGFELIITIEQHSESVNSVAFSPDGQYLAIGSQDKTCSIWEVENEFELIKVMQGFDKQVISVTFSADCKYLATGIDDDNSTCFIWSVEQGFEVIHGVEGETRFIQKVVFSTDNKYLATFSQKNGCIWDMQNGFELINKIETGHTDNVYSAAFTSDSKYLTTGSRDKTCKIWSVEKEFELVYTIQDHAGYIYSNAFSTDDQYLATGSFLNICTIWNVETGFELINSIDKYNSNQSSTSFSSDGKYLVTISEGITCKIWNLEKGFELTNKIVGHDKTIQSVAFSADDKYLATGSDDTTCKIWNVKNGFELVNKIEGHNSSILSVAFSADSKYLATASLDKTCKIWNLQNGFQLIKNIEGLTTYISQVLFSADGKYLITCQHDEETFKIWNAEKGFELLSQNEMADNEINKNAFQLYQF